MRKPEILAPTGNLEKSETAVDFGTDAVYIGGSKLNLGAFTGSFTNEQIAEGVEYTHGRGRKVYVTMNIFPHNADLEGLEEYIVGLNDLNVDVVMVSDPSMIMTTKKVAPDLEIHLGTRANNVSWESAKFWHSLRVKRIVLARELSFKEIEKIHENLPENYDLEALVHGSMCMAYSGRCLISNYITGRDSNGGAYSQACRRKYYLAEGKKPGEYFQVIEDDKGTHTMSSKDLCMIEYIPELIKSGVYSFKIEGRTKGPYYVATIVKAYRETLDKYWNDPEGYEFDQKLVDNPSKVSHRRYHTGSHFGKSEEQVYESSSYVRDYDIVGVVRDYSEETKVATIEQRNRLFGGDTVEVLTPVRNHHKIQTNDMKDEKDEKIDVTNKAQMMFKVRIDKPVRANDMLIKCKRADS